MPSRITGQIVVLLTMLLVTACAVPSAPLVEPESGPVPPSVETVVAETVPTPEPDVAAADCFQPVPDTEQFIDRIRGYCFLYPRGYAIVQTADPQTVAVLAGLILSDMLRLEVTVSPAEGRTLEQAADQIEAEYGLPGMEVLRSSIMLGGEEAIVLDGLPGQDINRRVVAVHEDRLVQLMVAPTNGDAPTAGEVQILYELVVNSFTFLPAGEMVEEAEVCPQATTGEHLYVNEEAGYCLLYPDGYEIAYPNTSNIAILAPPSSPGHRERALINVEDAAGRTAEEVANQLATDAAPSGMQPEITFGQLVGGEGAYILDNMPGQDLNRRVVVVHDGRLYDMMFIPADPEQGEAYAEMEAVYDTVMASLTFVAPESAQEDPPVLLWEGYTELVDGDKNTCESLLITDDNQTYIGPCGAVEAQVDYVGPQWAEIRARFAPFTYDTPEESLIFHGEGEVAGPAWEQALLAWSRISFAEAATGRTGAAVRTLLSWWLGEIEGQTGLCRHLVVLDYGYAYANVTPCQGGQTASTTAGWLETAEWETIHTWVTEFGYSTQGDSYLGGQATEAMDEATLAALSAWAEDVYGRLAP